ncbi:hypothetical protein FocnCong_v015121 [Fusarium oxysporum f. sp. conglutinans]|nr:hypothetical protein FocnCong_v015121 [Fusarium oxysporum f. sp. conglutinans]
MQTSQEDPLKRTCIARDQYSCWYDHVLFPAIAAAVRDPNILQYIPKNLNISQTNSRVRQEGISTERLSDMNAEFGILGQGRRSTSLSYVLQNRHLEAIWEGVRTRAATYPLFAGIKLYLGAKNLKLVYMNADIRQTIRAWRSQWQIAVDQVFLDPSDTYVDIGRQYTPRIGSVAEANVLMWQRCRLKQLWRQRQVWSSQYNAMYPFVRSSLEDIATSESRSVPLRLIEYPRFTLRDTIDMTIQPADKSREVGEGLIYSQFYNLVKIPFDAAKQYPFQNRQLEKMALDPSYVADYERSTRGSHANQASLSLAYRLSKLRSKQVTSQSGQRQSSEVEREGLGLNRTSKDYGLGWWLPGKFNWDEWRFRGDVNERLVAGNSLLHIEYGRQWKVIKDIRDVHARMWQANKWVKQYSVRKSQRNRNIWFEYLSNTVIELFQSEVWRAARKSLDWKSGSDLTDEAAASYPADQPPPYCYDALASSFHDRRRNVNHTRPYFLTGNKIRSSSVWDLVCDHLGFNLHDGRLESRDGLQPLHHRIAVRRSVEMISDVLGHSEACRWYKELGHLLLLTNWILPWPSTRLLISTTKENHRKNLKRRLIWVSLIYAPAKLSPFLSPNLPTHPLKDEERCITAHDNLRQTLTCITAERFGASGWTEDCDPSEPRFHWTSEDLLQYVGGTVTIGSFKIGRAVQSGSRKGFIYPLAERGRPPVLRLTDRIRGPAAQSLGFRYLQLLARKRPRTAEERERLRRHFRRRDCVRVSKVVVGTDSIHSDDTGSSAQTEETDQLWRPQKRLRKAVRDQMIVRLE